ncbi:MAG TPA: hypothetical protein VFH55_11665 [Nitrospiria bacterium]|nr:hypothetical protein [Nitrospiria bacterium]
MADVANLEEKIKNLKKTISEKREKKSGAEGSLELRPFRKQLKRLQRRRRVLSAYQQRGTKAKGEKAEKENKPAPKPAAEKPAVDKEAKAG